MTAPASATIIPFPRSPQGTPTDPQERLRQALAGLEAALTIQREAVADWRYALGNLRDSVRGLGSSLQSYNEQLCRLGERVNALNAESKELEAWADEVINTK
jgi:chromosome segregation ATPase